MSCNVFWERSQRLPPVPNGVPRPQELGVRRALAAVAAAAVADRGRTAPSDFPHNSSARHRGLIPQPPKQPGHTDPSRLVADSPVPGRFAGFGPHFGHRGGYRHGQSRNRDS